jgi:hypothetical protein
MSELQLREVRASDWAMIEQIGQLRVRAWQTELAGACTMSSCLDEFDRIARHWVFFSDGEPVAAARLSIHATIDELPEQEGYAGVFQNPPPSPIASLNRLVVDPTVRGVGLSERLDAIRLDAAEEAGCRCAVGATDSGERRIRQMVRMGFEVVGLGKQFNSPLNHGCRPAVLMCFLPRKTLDSPKSLNVLDSK